MAEVATIKVRIVFTNQRALRALRILYEVMDDLEEDFAYRDDIKRAARACRFLSKSVCVVPDKGD